MRRTGFTLIEVLVALAIVAIGLAAALRASAVGSDGTGEYRERLLAAWVAENIASERAGAQDWPQPGAQRHEEEMAGARFIVEETVSATPNPRFRRLDIDVLAERAQERRLRRLSIFLTQK